MSYGKIILIIFALSGMTALVYEIVWIRPLALVFGTTIYATSIIIASFLLGLALGSWIGGKYSDRMNNPLRFYGIVELGIGSYGIMLIPLFSTLPYVYVNIYDITFPDLFLSSVLQFMLAFAIILMPTTLMGATLPLVMRSYSESFGKIGKDLGRLYSVNNIGAVAGTLAAGFILLPVLGIKQSIITAALINFSLSIVVLLLAKTRPELFLTVIVIIVIVLVFAFFVTYDFKALDFGAYFYSFPGLQTSYLKSFLGEENVKFHKESMYSDVTVFSIEGVDVLKIDGKTECSSSYIDMQNMEMVAVLPYHLFKDNYGNPHSAMIVGLGCGSTSRWLSQRVNTTTIEIDPVVVEASRLYGGKINQTLIVDDARNWLLRNNVKFDLILSQPKEPFADQGYLFTSEYFSLLHSRLTTNGLAAVWVPAYVMNLDDFYTFYNTFHLSFPFVYAYANDTLTSDVIFIGSNKSLKLDNQNLVELDKVISSNRYSLNTDDRPIIEFSTASNIYKHNSTAIFEKFSEWK